MRYTFCKLISLPLVVTSINLAWYSGGIRLSKASQELFCMAIFSREVGTPQLRPHSATLVVAPLGGCEGGVHRLLSPLSPWGRGVGGERSTYHSPFTTHQLKCSGSLG